MTDEERRVFADGDPLGFILFARNIRDPHQVADLVVALRSSVGRPDAPILIDQEGGRVQRLRPPHWRAAPPAAVFGRLHAQDPAAGQTAARLNGRLIGRECRALGIDMICAPCVDLAVVGAHDVIGDRAFASAPERVAELAGAMAVGLAETGVMPVMKHMPGHGRAGADSHHHLPVVPASRATLLAEDGVPFRALAGIGCGMTAHVLYPALDDALPATISPKVVGFIREMLGFRGLLLTDDLGMAALGGTPVERAQAALAAGCDVALYCAGTIESARALLAAVAPLSETGVARFEAARRAAQPSCPPEPAVWRGRLDALLRGAMS